MDPKINNLIEKAYAFHKAWNFFETERERIRTRVTSPIPESDFNARTAAKYARQSLEEAALELPERKSPWQSLPDPNAEAHWIWVTMPAGESYITLWRGKTTVEAWPECLFCPIEKPEPPKIEGEKS